MKNSKSSSLKGYKRAIAACIGFGLALSLSSGLYWLPQTEKNLKITAAATEKADWLTTKGNKIVDMDGNEVWLTGVNWFGLNTQTHTFDGLWASNLYVNLELIADHGLNLLRIPVATELLLNWKNGDYYSLEWEFNRGKNYYIDEENRVYDEKYDVLKDLGKTLAFDSTYVNPTDYEVFNVALKKCKELGIKVMIDVHSSEIDNMGHQWPLWYKGAITTNDYYAGLEWLADTYKDDDTIIAIDLKNEPHGKYKDAQYGGEWAIWDDSTSANNWRYVAGVAGKKVLDINPNLLIMVEGIEVYPKEGETWESSAGGYGEPENYYGAWWGGNFRGVKEYPVDLGEYQDQLVYSPHDYGPSVYDQTWFYEGFDKQTLHDDYWYDSWAYIYEDGGAVPYTTEYGAVEIPKKEGADEYTTPLLIGEWGGFVEGDADERGGTTALTIRNTHWLTQLQHYIIENHIHHTFWCFNYNSSDTGGLMYDDFAKWNEPKYQFLKPALWQTDDGVFIGLDHDIPIGANGMSLSDYYSDTPKNPTTSTTTTSKTTSTSVTTGSSKYPIGDIDLDGTAGKVSDIITLAKYLSGNLTLSQTAVDVSNCDISDSKINASDLSALINYLLNEIKTLPYGG
ncbi:MAG: cellulase family glycosylhydrolase [Oscillospiraceae bacterium]|jgi:aryl-phospho-beta-D-glucosidase BglC (GH1 family)|nr:cellulase family glycosylhydrolase [Oscillospiraceae bacterium]